MTIPSHTLAYGNYAMQLQLRTVTKGSGDLVGYGHVTTWLEVLPSPLLAHIKGGFSRSHSKCSEIIIPMLGINLFALKLSWAGKIVIIFYSSGPKQRQTLDILLYLVAHSNELVEFSINYMFAS